MQTLSLPTRYRIQSLIGQGAAGRVYRIVDSMRARILALKIVPGSDIEFLRREFDTLRQIRHQNLVQVFDWSTVDSGEAYYTMELVEGADWGRAMGAAQAPTSVRQILAGTLRGLAHLHAHDEIHGDLKPGNVLLGAGGVVKVADVGLAHRESEGGVAGTPGYSAPECWEGAAPNVRSDIYSVGVMAYEALTGRHPFGARTIRDVVAGQMQGWVPSPSAHGVAVPPDLERVVMRALEREPSIRQASADEFMEGLGIEDRVGEILGGRFVAREEELQSLLSEIAHRSVESPTLISVAGTRASGRNSLISELAHHAAAAGAQIIEWDSPSVSALARAIAGEGSPMGADGGDDGTDGPSAAINEILKHSRRRSLVIIARPSEESTGALHAKAQQLCRYLATVARELSRPLPVVFLVPTTAAATPGGKFETVSRLQPLETDGVARLIRGLLGRANLESALVEKICQETGGMPGRVIRVALELVSRGLLVRRDGAWRFLESERIRDMRFSAVERDLTTVWIDLNHERRAILAAFSIVPTGLSESALSAVVGKSVIETRSALEGMSLHSLVTQRQTLWVPGSEVTLGELMSVVDASLAAEAAEALLGTAEVCENPEAAAAARSAKSCDWREAIRASQAASARSDFVLAALRAEAGRGWASADGEQAAVQRLLLLQADAAHRLGRHDQAQLLLSDDHWPTSSAAGPAELERHFLLGRASLELGDLAGARLAFEEAVQGAPGDQGSAIALRVHAALGEMDWRYGSGEARLAAIKRLREVLASTATRSDLAEERAALLYQVGAALIEEGQREGAQIELEAGLQIPCGAYWHMRMRNALATIHFYHGDFAGSLALLDAAWVDAESNSIDNFKARILSNRAGLYYGIGKFREAVEQHRLSALWGQRTGSTFEYLAACLGESINLCLLAKYEEAMKRARDAREVALSLPNIHEVAKSFEIEGLALHCIGSDDAALESIEQAANVLKGRGFDDVWPRLHWLEARILGRRGEHERAEVVLRRAEAMLRETRDWEDLPGVEIELSRLAWRRGVPGSSTVQVREATMKALTDGAVVVALRGCLVLTEILADHGIDDPDLERLVLRGLALAEQSGTREFIWRLSSGLGRLGIRRSDREMSQQRLSHSLRVLREVSAELTSTHLQIYLSTPHARALLSSLEQGKSG